VSKVSGRCSQVTSKSDCIVTSMSSAPVDGGVISFYWAAGTSTGEVGYFVNFFPTKKNPEKAFVTSKKMPN
jgi:hypothetical protein